MRNILPRQFAAIVGFSDFVQCFMHTRLETLESKMKLCQANFTIRHGMMALLLGL